MKYQSILFACSIAFMTLAVLDSIEAQVEQYASFDDFFADLQQTADSLVDFVRKIQALMCPEQPVCGGTGELEKDVVLRTLPTTLIVDNVTVKLDDVHSYAGVCCLPCSCTDTCWQYENCCPTKQVLSNHKYVLLLFYIFKNVYEILSVLCVLCRILFNLMFMHTSLPISWNRICSAEMCTC